MASSVLVIDSEEWVSAMLIDALRDDGLDAYGVSSAEEGRNTIIRRRPDCVVCALDVPGPGGLWLLEAVRKEAGPTSVTPFLLLATDDQDEQELERARSSIDRVVSKPFNVDEVLVTVKSLLDDAPRLRSGHHNTRPPVADPDSLTAGALKDTSASTLLAVLEMERRNGCLEVMGEGRYVTLVLSDGYVISGAVDGEPATPLGAVKQLLACKSGNFSLKGIPPQPPADHHNTIRELVRLATGNQGAPDGGKAPAPPGRPPTQVLPPVGPPPAPRHRARPLGPRPRAPAAPVAHRPRPVAAPTSATTTPIMATPSAGAPAPDPAAAAPVPERAPTPPMPKPDTSTTTSNEASDAGLLPGPLDTRLSVDTVEELLAGLEESIIPPAAEQLGSAPKGEPTEEEIEEEVLEVEADLSSFRPPAPED